LTPPSTAGAPSGRGIGVGGASAAIAAAPKISAPARGRAARSRRMWVLVMTVEPPEPLSAERPPRRCGRACPACRIRSRIVSIRSSPDRNGSGGNPGLAKGKRLVLDFGSTHRP
jgi:hypothetical protein